MIELPAGSSTIKDCKESLGETRTLTRRVSFMEAFRFWAKLGFISFGGPAGQIAIMHTELVDRRRWLSEERFLHSLNYCMLLPGPEAQQLAIYIGWLIHRTWGGIVAGTLFVLPSVVILLVLSYAYAVYGHVPAVAGVLAGFKPVVVAIVIEAVLKIGRRAFKRRVHYLIGALAFVSIYFLHVPFPLIVLVSGAIGFLGVRYLSGAFTPILAKKGPPNRPPDNGGEVESPLVISDEAPPPEHTLPRWRRSLRISATVFLLWLSPFLLLFLWQGPDAIYVKEYLFFTKAALVTFGGAYAVLAYVTQAAIGTYQWITPTQAVDGLALAETTPGPLIMVLQFVGFMAGWNHPPDGISPTLSAIAGALITTYTTFLPCFFFIFLGAPYIETLRGNVYLNGTLSGITSAIVGVILNLALIFGTTVIFPGHTFIGIDLFAALLSAGALMALYKFRVDVVWVVLSGGAIGLARALIFG